MTKRLPVIGLLGGGQLGRMLQEAAAPLGIELVILDDPHCPAKQICHNAGHVSGSFRDADSIRKLAARCDVLTVEIEHVNTAVLEEIATRGVPDARGRTKIVPVHPSWETLRLIGDKFLQKEHLRKAGIATARQVAVPPANNAAALAGVAEHLGGFPFMLKARRGSYDGRGNRAVHDEEDFEPALAALLGSGPAAAAAAATEPVLLYAEQWVPFVEELAVMVVRTEDDEGNVRSVVPYPAVETVHEDSICTKVFYPPRSAGGDVARRAEVMAADVVRTLKGRGVFAVEMFATRGGELYVNEVAPRPHNSGHLWIEAMPQMSQFKAQLCAILDRFPSSLARLRPRVAAAVMLNVLGGAREDSHEALVDMTYQHVDGLDVHLHLYGKASEPGRKIGHITATSPGEVDLDALAAPLIREVDHIRRERLFALTSAPSAPLSRKKTLTTDSAESSTPVPTDATHKSSRDPQHPLVVVTMGSDSDLPVLRGAFEVMEKFGVPYDLTITSAHRTPHRMAELGRSAAARGVRVLIAAAGGAAHLPGMLASETTLPVIGVPVKATHLDGHDSLLSIVQMPRGCPVATVGINNSTNAALLAVKILGATDAGYRDAMAAYMRNMGEEVERKAERLRSIGWEAYLEK